MHKKYRLYIDESGTHDYSQSDDEDKRYLSLTGVIIEDEIYRKDIKPRIDRIKEMFMVDPDEPPILHREEIIYKKGDFSKLQDPSVETEFNRQLLALYSDCDFAICCVVIDKKTHQQRYGRSAQHPYHYCLNVILERYVMFLLQRGMGDVIAEARGKKEDRALGQVYDLFFQQGTYYLRPELVQRVLTSRNIKLKKKDRHTVGLEIADLLAIPTKKDTLAVHSVIQLRENFTKTIIESIQERYYKSDTTNHVIGCGKKFIR